MKADVIHKAFVQQTKERLHRGDLTIEWNDGLTVPIGCDPFDADNPWVTLCDLTYRLGGWSQVIEKGFRGDGASVGPLLIVLFLLLGFTATDPTIYAAHPHDKWYRTQRLPRVLADAAFLAIMLAINPHRNKKGYWRAFKRRLWVVRSFAMYWGIRCGGWWAWRRNGRKLAAARKVNR